MMKTKTKQKQNETNKKQKRNEQKRNEMKQKRTQAGSRIRTSKNAGRKPDAIKKKRGKVRAS